MSERKVINKYYPPDYDPQKAEKQVRQLSKQLKTMQKDSMTIRLMTPFSMRCLKCSEYIPKFRKFNGKKEVLPEKYLDTIKIYRLRIKCPRCNSMISFRTDPNSDNYVMEVGGVRNYVRQGEKEHIRASETTEETLERLLSEEQAALRAQEDQGEDKLDVLEKHLAKLQQEQQDDELVEALYKTSYERMRRAAALNAPDHSSKPEHDIEQLANAAFNVHASRTTSCESDIKPSMENDIIPDTSIGHTWKGKSLGIVTKKKKKLRPRS